MSKQKKSAPTGKPAKVKTPVKKAAKPVAKKEASILDQYRAKASDDLVVFAIRVTEAERDAIHAAAGPGKASRFVRAVAIAAAKGDEAMLREILKERQSATSK